MHSATCSAAGAAGRCTGCGPDLRLARKCPAAQRGEGRLACGAQHQEAQREAVARHPKRGTARDHSHAQRPERHCWISLCVFLFIWQPPKGKSRRFSATGTNKRPWAEWGPGRVSRSHPLTPVSSSVRSSCLPLACRRCPLWGCPSRPQWPCGRRVLSAFVTEQKHSEDRTRRDEGGGKNVSL